MTTIKHFGVTAFLIGTGGAGAEISGIDVISSTQIRVNFTNAVTDNPALSNVVNYETTPTLEIISATPESGYSGPGPTFVDLVTSEQLGGQEYDLTIHNIE